MMPKTMQNVIHGRILRTLETTNTSESETVRQLSRLVAGMRVAGIPSLVVLRSVRKTSLISWCNLKPVVTHATSSSMHALRMWSQAYDLTQRALRLFGLSSLMCLKHLGPQITSGATSLAMTCDWQAREELRRWGT